MKNHVLGLLAGGLALAALSPVCGAQGADLWQQGLPLGGEQSSLPAPDQQGHPPFPLQAGDGAADG